MDTDRNLENAIQSLKTELRAEVLSDRSRARVFDEVRRPLGWLEAVGFYFPHARVAAAITMPVALTAGLLLSLPISNGPGRHPKILAHKDNENVVFTVSNGHRDHRVFKSTDPTRFGVKEVDDVGGRFSDRANNGIELVFYRVD